MPSKLKKALKTVQKKAQKLLSKSSTSKSPSKKKGLKLAPAKAVSVKTKVTPEKAPAVKTVAKVVGKAGKSAPAPTTVVAKNGKAPATKLTRGKSGLPVTSLRASHHHSDESVCREVACENLSTTSGYCRLHYIKNWKKIQRKVVILKEKKLNQYIEELVAKYPDKYIEAIRQDLANDKDFAKVIHDLDLDEGIDEFGDGDESMDTVLGDIKRDFEDEGGEGF